MAKEFDTQASLAEMLKEAKRYYGLQKEYLRYSAAEQLTQVISKLTIVAVLAVVGFVIFIFAGLAIVHWVGATLGSMALAYALYALLMLVLLIIFYINRRRWVILPLARLMTKTFIKEEKEEEDNDD